MAANQQLHLFLPENPLASENWSTFFRGVCNRPGVYLFLDANERILYVGKSKKLRQRLHSYRASLTAIKSTKTRRLLLAVSSIKYKIMSSEFHALLEEDRLIKKFRPAFNVQNNQFDTYYYFHLKKGTKPSNWIFSLSMRSELATSEYCFGAFKGHLSTRRALGALNRLLHFVERASTNSFHFPIQSLRKLSAIRSSHFLRAHTLNRLADFLNGTSFRLLRQMEWKAIRRKVTLGTNEFRLIEQDLHTLYQFYYRSCKPLSLNKKEKAFTSKNQLDAKLITWVHKHKE